MRENKHQPIVIIGAARSGTNILRDCLVSLDGFGTWPCDEINYIWRHGNRAHPNDEFPAEFASAPVKSYLVKQFLKQADSLQCRYLVEKTTANSLRVGFVHSVLPDAKYIVIYRHGLDSVSSAMKRWKAPLDIGYILKKARYVPLSDILYYGIKYLKNRIHKIFSKEKTLSTWGPKPNAELGDDLVVRAATQWAECVRLTREQMLNIDPTNVIEIKYEDFVSKPDLVLGSIMRKFHIELDDEVIHKAAGLVHSNSVNKGSQGLSEEQKASIQEVIQSQLVPLGYSFDG